MRSRTVCCGFALLMLGGMGCLKRVDTQWLTAKAQFYPSSRPVLGPYTKGVPVRAEGCEPSVSVDRLIREATGHYDAVVEMTIQHQVRWHVMKAEQYVGIDNERVCWVVTGIGVFFGNVDADDELRRRLAE